MSGWKKNGTYNLTATQALYWGGRDGVRSFSEAIERLIGAGIEIVERHQNYVVVRIETVGVIWTALTGQAPNPVQTAYHDRVIKRSR